MTIIYRVLRDRATWEYFVVGFNGRRIVRASGALTRKEVARGLNSTFNTDPLNLEYIRDLWTSNLLVEVQL